MITAKHMGKCGDILFSLPTIKALGIEVLYIPQNTPDGCQGMLDNLRPLLEQQPYIREVREYPSGLGYMELAEGIEIDYDLDRARLQTRKGIIHIVKRYMDAFNVNIPNWRQPWLTVDGETANGEYTVINYTGRHTTNMQTNETSKVDWRKVVEGIDGPKVFVGHQSEYEWFNHHVAEVKYVDTANALALALVIKGAKAVYCNQSFALAICQAIGVEYFVDIKPGKTNCLIRTDKEHLL